jgi:hypothetical protein
MVDVKNVTSNNLQMILRQRFETIKYGNKNDVLPAQQDIDELYEYFVVINNIMSPREFRYNLVCAEVAAKR